MQNVGASMQGCDKNISEDGMISSTKRRSAARGRLILTVATEVARSIIAALEEDVAEAPDLRDIHIAGAPLTDREEEVLVLIVRGYSNRSAGQLLRISPRTVEVHRSRIIEKIGSKSPLALVLAAQRLGLLTLPPTDHAEM